MEVYVVSDKHLKFDDYSILGVVTSLEYAEVLIRNEYPKHEILYPYHVFNEFLRKKTLDVYKDNDNYQVEITIETFVVNEI